MCKTVFFTLISQITNALSFELKSKLQRALAFLRHTGEIYARQA